MEEREGYSKNPYLHKTGGVLTPECMQSLVMLQHMSDYLLSAKRRMTASLQA